MKGKIKSKDKIMFKKQITNLHKIIKEGLFKMRILRTVNSLPIVNTAKKST